mgnify:CR=1 FL=1
MEKLNIENELTLERDSFSKAILNKDRSNFTKSKNRKRIQIERQKELITLRGDVDELKSMVKMLLEKH